MQLDPPHRASDRPHHAPTTPMPRKVERSGGPATARPTRDLEREPYSPVRRDANRPIGVLVADDDPFVREGVERILDSIPGCDAPATAATSGEVLRRIAPGDLDVLLLDIRLPGAGPTEIVRHAKRAQPTLRVIVLSVDIEPAQVLEILDAGADGFVAKKDAHRELAGALETVTGGDRYVSSSMAQRLMDGAVGRPLHGLSTRELQVLRMLAEGQRIRDIASTLEVSPKTVSTYRARVLEKTGLENNADLVRYAIRNQLSR